MASTQGCFADPWFFATKGRFPPPEPAVAILDLSQVKPVRVSDLLDRRDAAGLARLLQKGWRPPKAIGAEGYDLTFVCQVILNGWSDGWDLFRSAIPEILDDPMLWTLALQSGRAHIVNDFLVHGMDPFRPGDTGLDALQTVVASLGRHWSLPWGQGSGAGAPVEEDEDMARTIRLLLEQGMSLLSSHPGEFSPGDMSSVGHTAWTRALAQRRWTLANQVFPLTWEDVLAQPRSGEAVLFLRSRAILEPSGEAAILWQRWLEEFAGPWFAAGAPPLDRPEDASFICALGPSAREEVWRSMALADDAGWTGLHHLALHGARPEVLGLLAMMMADAAVCLGVWDCPDTGGVSPAELWALAMEEAGHVISVPSPAPADVLLAAPSLVPATGSLSPRP